MVKKDITEKECVSAHSFSYYTTKALTNVTYGYNIEI